MDTEIRGQSHLPVRHCQYCGLPLKFGHVCKIGVVKENNRILTAEIDCLRGQRDELRVQCDNLLCCLAELKAVRRGERRQRIEDFHTEN